MDPETIKAPNPLVDSAWTGLRQVLPPIMAFAVGRNWVENDLALLLGVIGAIVWPIVAGQLKTLRRANQLVSIKNDARVPAAVIQ